MAPADISCFSTRDAPTPRMAICSIGRTNLVIAVSTPARSLASACSKKPLAPLRQPAMAQARQHAHRVDRVRIGRHVGRELRGSGHVGAGVGQRAPGAELAGQGQHEQGRGTDQRHDEKQRVDEIDDDQEKRRPGCVKEEEQALASEKVAQRVEVAQRTGPG